eukprot:gene1739-508_t
MTDSNSAEWAELNRVLEIWKKIDLNTKKPTFDANDLQIKENQEKSKESRKHLGKETKDFKKLSDEEKISSITKLLKSYQTEIDNLTRRSTTSEKSFQEIFELLHDAPDPSLIMTKILKEEKKVSNNKDLIQKCSELEEKIKEYETEFKELTNQEVIIRNLEEKVKEYQTNIDETIKQQVESKQHEWSLENSKIIKDYKENEQNLNELVENLKEQVKDLQKRYNQSQNETFKLQNSVDNLNSSHQTQLEMLNDEIRKLQSKVILLTNESNSNSKHEEEGSFQNECNDDLKLEIEQNKILVTQLKEQIQMLKNELIIKENEIKENENENSKLHEEFEIIQQQLNLRPSLIEHEKLKKRLEMIEDIEFKNIANASTKTIEQILSEKNHHKEKEITDLKMSLSNQTLDLKNSKIQISNLTKQLEEQRELIEKLENDLGSQTHENSEEKTLDIVSEQRNRFKRKVEELEDENLNLNKILTENEKEKDRLKQDNIKMYEKVRYLQNYRNNPKEIVIDMNDDDDSKYKKLYDDSLKDNLNPFKQFNKNEKEERYKELSTAEKIMLNLIEPLVILNVFSRYVFLQHIPDKSAKSVAIALINIFQEHGYPHSIGFDLGKEFINDTLQYLNEQYSIKHHSTMQYQPFKLVER